MGLWKAMPSPVNPSPQSTSMKQALVMMEQARSWSPCPRAMEHRGEPPTPKRLAKAVTRVTTGKHSPSPARARVPSPGNLPM